MRRPGQGRRFGAAPAAEEIARLSRRLSAKGRRFDLAWGTATGARLARRTRVLGFDGRTLHVAVPDSAWAQHLDDVTPQLLVRLIRASGRNDVRAIRYQVREDAFSDEPASRSAPRPEVGAEVSAEDRALVAAAGVTDPGLCEAIARAMAAARQHAGR